MKLTLKGSLHARPANLFVRVASGFAAVVELRKGERAADAKNILEVLTLGAAMGDLVEIFATGDDAEAAIAALALLVDRNFDSDLVPETGAAAAPGIAVGTAVVIGGESSRADDSATKTTTGPESEIDEQEKAIHAFAEVRRDLEALVTALSAEEATLFAPEIAIVQALESKVMDRIARGEGFEKALDDELDGAGARVSHDLVRDARERLLEAHSGEARTNVAARLAALPAGDVVLVARQITPSLVSSLPRRVTGIIAIEDDAETMSAGAGYASHAAILARGRDLPLLYVAPHVGESIGDGDKIVLDTRHPPAQLWTAPCEARVTEARARAAEERQARRDAEKHAGRALAHLVRHGGAPFAVRVNVGTVHDLVPLASNGVGLVRSELLHGGRRAPRIDEQLATLALVAGKVHEGPIVVRLFDGGGDKALAWLPAPSDAPDARGIALLAWHAAILRDQVSAIGRAREGGDVRLLIPFVESAADVEKVRALCPSSLAVGAMIESPAGVSAARAIADAADFICIGTNDLAASIRGEDRSKMSLTTLDPSVLAAVSTIVRAAHAADRAVTVCGEMAGEPEGACILAGLGVDAVSVAPSRFLAVKNALLAATAAACSEAADRATKKGTPTP
ncbi:MAG: HPr family phosphocarrier protein [Polyangiaceae bacterium]